MEQSLNDSCLFVYRVNKKIEGLLIFHVDDFLSAGSSIFEVNVMDKLRKKYLFGKVERKVFTFTGIEVKQDADYQIQLSQKLFVESLEILNFGKIGQIIF